MEAKDAMNFLTTSEAARLLDRSADSVRSYERRGLLRAIKTSRGLRLFELVDILAFKTDGENKQANANR